MLTTSLSRRSWLHICAAAAIGVTLATTAADSARAQERVTISHAAATLLRLPLYVAVQNGYFKEEGIDLQIVDTRSGSDAMKMLAGGSVNFSTGQLLDSINLNKQGIHVQGVAMLTQRLANSIVVRTASADKVKSMRDLKGKTVGVTAVGSGTWQFAAYVASLEGLTTEDFNFIGVGAGGNVIGAIKAGRVEAMSYADPENPKMVADGDAKYLIDTTDEATHRRLVGETYLNNQIMVLASYIKAKPQVVQGFVNAIQRGLNWAHSHSPEEVAQLIHKFPAFADSDYGQFRFSIDRMMPHGLAKTAVITRTAFDNAMKLPLAIKAIDAAMPYEQLVETRFAEEAAKKYPPAGM
jgi:NitT/TauT family transport system substrate-binding protein